MIMIITVGFEKAKEVTLIRDKPLRLSTDSGTLVLDGIGSYYSK